MRKLYATIRRNERLAERRSPMFEKNRFAKFLLAFNVAFWAAYLIFIGVMLYVALSEEAPHMEPYHLLNSGLPVILLLDFLVRFLMQVPAQEVKPYLLLPVPRHKVVNLYLLRAGLSGFNLFWLFLFVPFSLLSVTRFYGLTGVLLYNLGIVLLMVANAYWSVLARSFIRQSAVWMLLPAGVYGVMALLEFLPDTGWTGRFFMDLGEGYILGSPLAFGLTLVCIGGLFLLNSRMQERFIFQELGRVEDKNVRISNYRFLDGYGLTGEYIRLELKLMFRNKMPKRQFWMFIVCMGILAGILVADAEESMSSNFGLVYCYSLLGLMTLSTILSSEGNYIDGLMVRKESLRELLHAKYYMQCVLLIIPFLMTLPAVFLTDHVTLLTLLAFVSFSMGCSFPMMMQLAVYNNRTINLNAAAMQKSGGNSAYQSLIMGCSFGVPLILIGIIRAFADADTTYLILLLMGLPGIALHKWWIENIYRRFRKRRYANMEGFRNTR